MVTNELRVVSIKNKNKMELSIINYGATITNLFVPDRNGNLIDIIVGLSDPKDYIDAPYSNVKLYLGASIGRYAGRISKGQFEVEGKVYKINHNEGVHLHGGKGFDERYWDVEEVKEDSVVLSYFSKHMEEGYPGNLKVLVKYEITENNCLNIEYTATTDESTPVNLTSHPYLNLNGEGSILQHELVINSKQYLEVDEKLLPTGKLKDSKNTQYDRSSKFKIEENNFSGFDDTFVLNDDKLKASLYAKESGILLNIYSNQPAMVVYTPKTFPILSFKKDYASTGFPAICFETQNFPDAPNISHFPNAILKPKSTFVNKTIFEFESK